jgi:hypothetical protein
MPTTSLDLDQIQGNSIGGFNKDFQTNLFLRFTGDVAGRAWVKEINEEVAVSSSAASYAVHSSPPNDDPATRRQHGAALASPRADDATIVRVNQDGRHHILYVRGPVWSAHSRKRPPSPPSP